MTGPFELSRPFAVERLANGPVALVVTATADECVAIAARLLVPSVRSLTCRFALAAASGSARPGEITAHGSLRADLDRECVVTLDPFPTTVEERFDVRFVVEGTESEADDPEADDEIPYGGVTIDLGEAAVEQLALTLDPYPRKPGAELPAEAADADESPFAALARLGRPG